MPLTTDQRDRIELLVAHFQAMLDTNEINTGPIPHVYLSTGCLHDDHEYCCAMTGRAGAKNPASCKFCGTVCLCPVCCH